MKVFLFHNPDAGGAVSAGRVREALRRAGIEVVREIEEDTEFDELGPGAGVLVAVAGGDGTVRRAVRALAGKDLPLGVLPIGTANNVARSLGVEGTVEEVISLWPRGRAVRFDLGLARGPWGEDLFLEGVGCGLVPAGIERFTRARRSVEDEGDPESALTAALRSQREVLPRLEPRPTSLSVDGETLEAPLFLVEVLNVSSVGPRLALAADADPSDGLFDLVMAGDADRDALLAYLDGRLEGRSPRLALPLRRARRVTIRGWGRFHIDDRRRQVSRSRTVEVEMLPGSVSFWI